MKKKILSLVLVAALALTAVGSTLAYFTDTESATNTFTVGSVDIQLLESQYYTNVDTDKTWEDIEKDAETYDEYLEETGKNLVPGKEVKKAIYVENTGKNDAYVRVRIQLPKDVASRVSYMMNSTYIENQKPDDKNEISMTTKTLEDNTLEATFTYLEPIAAGKYTEHSPVWKFWLNKDLDNEDFNGLNLGSITVYADAIQAEGFETAAEAFAAFAGQTDASTDHQGKIDSTDTVNFKGDIGVKETPATPETPDENA